MTSFSSMEPKDCLPSPQRLAFDRVTTSHPLADPEGSGCSTHYRQTLGTMETPSPYRAAPGKFEAKRFCSEKRVITRCDGTYCCIFVVLYMKEPSHADPSAPLSRGRPPHVGYGVETDERGPGLP